MLTFDLAVFLTCRTRAGRARTIDLGILRKILTLLSSTLESSGTLLGTTLPIWLSLNSHKSHRADEWRAFKNHEASIASMCSSMQWRDGRSLAVGILLESVILVTRLCLVIAGWLEGISHQTQIEGVLSSVPLELDSHLCPYTRSSSLAHQPTWPSGQQCRGS